MLLPPGSNSWVRKHGFLPTALSGFLHPVLLPQEFRKSSESFVLLHTMHDEIEMDNSISAYIVVKKLYRTDAESMAVMREERKGLKYASDFRVNITFPTTSEAAYFQLKWC